MAKKIYFVFLISITISFGSKAQTFDFSFREVSKINNRKLIVILQEEEPSMLNRFKKNELKTKQYKALIAYTNNLLKKVVTTFWKTGQAIEFRTYKECKGLADTSQAYITLDFTSLRVNENSVLYLLKPDTLNPYGNRNELMRRKEYGYFELKLIEKFRSFAFYSFHTASSMPTEYDFITAIQFMSTLVRERIRNNSLSNRDYEIAIQQNNELLFKKTLMVDSNVVNKQSKGYSYIAKVYDSSCTYQLSDPKGIAEKAYSKDPGFAYLSIVPYLDPIGRGQSYIGASGGTINDYERKVYFMQLIFDMETGKLLYYDKTEENVILVKDWKKFLRYSRETFPLPKIEKSISPYQQQNPQNQY
jgi:hypothetical protein